MLFALIGIPFTLTVIADLGKFARIKFTQNTFQYGFFYATGRVFATAVSAVGKKLPSLTSKFNVSCFKWKFFLSFSLSLSFPCILWLLTIFHVLFLLLWKSVCTHIVGPGAASTQFGELVSIPFITIYGAVIPFYCGVQIPLYACIIQ